MSQTRTTSSFPTHGVRFSYIAEEFLEWHGGREAFEGLTTAQVREQIIAPFTLGEQRGSYCDWLRESANPAFGEQPEVFVSHAHNDLFLNLLSALKSHLKDDPEAVVWFDLFSIDQNEFPEDHNCWTFEWLSTTFQTAIGQFGRTVMVLDSWDNPKSFQRAWCIFEAYCTISTNSIFEIALNREVQTGFLDSMQRQHTNDDDDSNEDINTGHYEGMDEVLDRMLATIRSEKSEASVASDKNKIFAAIEATVGFATIDSMIFEAYRKWVVDISLNALASCDESNENDLHHLHHTIAWLYLNQGEVNLANNHVQKCLDIRRTRLGKSSREYFDALSLMGGVHQAQGNYVEAQKWFQKCLQRRREILGPNHWETLRAMSQLAMLHNARGDFKEAERLQKLCLKRRKQKFLKANKNHPDILQSMNDLGIIYFRQGRLDLALKLHHDCFLARRECFGHEHPQTLTSMNNLASIYDARGEYHLSEPLYQHGLERRRALYGKWDRRCLVAMNNLAGVHYQQRDYEKAHSLYAECLEQRKLQLGENHPQTLQTTNNMAMILCSLRKLHEAKILMEECWQRQKDTLGENNPSTLNAMNTLAGIYDRIGETATAEKMYNDCYQINEEVLGQDHPSTRCTMLNLVSFWEGQGDYEKALVFTKKCLSARSNKVNKTSTREDPLRLEYLGFLAGLYTQQGLHDQALPILEEVLVARRRTRGENDEIVFVSMDALAKSHEALGHSSEAAALYSEALDKRRQHLGEFHPTTLESLHTMARIVRTQQGRLEDAEAMFFDCYKMRCSVLGAGHSATLESLKQVGQALEDQKLYTDAVRAYRMCYEGELTLLGPNHPRTQETKYKIEVLECPIRDYVLRLAVQETSTAAESRPPKNFEQQGS